jgi:hypothetical protein
MLWAGLEREGKMDGRLEKIQLFREGLGMKILRDCD